MWELDAFCDVLDIANTLRPGGHCFVLEGGGREEIVL